MKKHIELDHFVDTHNRPFVVIGRDFTVVSVNKAYENTFQVKRGDLEGKKCHEILHHLDRPCFEMGEECPYAQCYMTEQPCSCLHTHYDQQGRTRWVRINLYPLRADDGSLYVGEMMEEIAAREESDLDSGQRPVGNSKAFLRTIEQLEQAARSDAPVLLIGETGTGKELAANLIHRYSQRSEHPFIALDCTVVTESLFESEVFGHEKGAFTGSAGAKEGLFEVADRGTLFIDEIGEATLNMQAKLLRVLELGEFRRVGGNKTLEANTRIVCATNRLLWERVKSGEFREDLYYRIACFCIRIPALRERLEDIPVLSEEILKRIASKIGRTYRLADEAIHYLSGYNYPGNIRELRNILQVAVAHSSNSPGAIITGDKIRQYLRMRNEFETPSIQGEAYELQQDCGVGSVVCSPESSAQGMGLPDLRELKQPSAAQSADEIVSLKDVEAKHIADLLRLYKGNRRQVAEVMGISERTLYRKLKRYGLGDIR
ncbi:MAG: sigma-54-dependent Fis family transcriptional regulator [Pseudomonadota bacterium]